MSIDWCFLRLSLFIFRPEFIEFFGLSVKSSNGSVILTAGASQTSNGNDSTAKANVDDAEDSSTSVVK